VVRRELDGDTIEDGHTTAELGEGGHAHLPDSHLREPGREMPWRLRAEDAGQFG
jgi:hypothetical protein